MSRNMVVVESLSHVQLFATLRTAAHQAPLPVGFSRQEYCSGLPFPSPGDLSNPWLENINLRRETSSFVIPRLEGAEECWAKVNNI